MTANRKWDRRQQGFLQTETIVGHSHSDIEPHCMNVEGRLIFQLKLSMEDQLVNIRTYEPLKIQIFCFTRK